MFIVTIYKFSTVSKKKDKPRINPGRPYVNGCSYKSRVYQYYALIVHCVGLTQSIKHWLNGMCMLLTYACVHEWASVPCQRRPSPTVTVFYRVYPLRPKYCVVLNMHEELQIVCNFDKFSPWCHFCNRNRTILWRCHDTALLGGSHISETVGGSF